MTIRLAAASVLITADIVVPASTTPNTMRSSLASALPTAAAATAALNITVETAPTIAIEGANPATMTANATAEKVQQRETLLSTLQTATAATVATTETVEAVATAVATVVQVEQEVSTTAIATGTQLIGDLLEASQQLTTMDGAAAPVTSGTAAAVTSAISSMLGATESLVMSAMSSADTMSDALSNLTEVDNATEAAEAAESAAAESAATEAEAAALYDEMRTQLSALGPLLVRGQEANAAPVVVKAPKVQLAAQVLDREGLKGASIAAPSGAGGVTLPDDGLASVVAASGASASGGGAQITYTTLQVNTHQKGDAATDIHALELYDSHGGARLVVSDLASPVVLRIATPNDTVVGGGACEAYYGAYNCSNHGTCELGQCKCDGRFSGANCATELRCRFWDEVRGNGSWQEDGLNTAFDRATGELMCRTSHLTDFLGLHFPTTSGEWEDEMAGLVLTLPCADGWLAAWDFEANPFLYSIVIILLFANAVTLPFFRWRCRPPAHYLRRRIPLPTRAVVRVRYRVRLAWMHIRERRKFYGNRLANSKWLRGARANASGISEAEQASCRAPVVRLPLRTHRCLALPLAAQGLTQIKKHRHSQLNPAMVLVRHALLEQEKKAKVHQRDASMARMTSLPKGSSKRLSVGDLGGSTRRLSVRRMSQREQSMGQLGVAEAGRGSGKFFGNCRRSESRYAVAGPSLATMSRSRSSGPSRQKVRVSPDARAPAPGNEANRPSWYLDVEAASGGFQSRVGHDATLARRAASGSGSNLLSRLNAVDNGTDARSPPPSPPSSPLGRRSGMSSPDPAVANVPASQMEAWLEEIGHRGQLGVSDVVSSDEADKLQRVLDSAYESGMLSYVEQQSISTQLQDVRQTAMPQRGACCSMGPHPTSGYNPVALPHMGADMRMTQDAASVSRTLENAKDSGLISYVEVTYAEDMVRDPAAFMPAPPRPAPPQVTIAERASQLRQQYGLPQMVNPSTIEDPSSSRPPSRTPSRSGLNSGSGARRLGSLATPDDSPTDGTGEGNSGGEGESDAAKKSPFGGLAGALSGDAGIAQLTIGGKQLNIKQLRWEQQQKKDLLHSALKRQMERDRMQKKFNLANAVEAAKEQQKSEERRSLKKRMVHLRQSVRESETYQLAKSRSFGKLATHVRKKSVSSFRRGVEDVVASTRDRHTLVAVAAPLSLKELDPMHLRDEQTAQIFWNVVVVELVVNAMWAGTSGSTTGTCTNTTVVNTTVVNDGAGLDDSAGGGAGRRAGGGAISSARTCVGGGNFRIVTAIITGMFAAMCLIITAIVCRIVFRLGNKRSRRKWIWWSRFTVAWGVNLGIMLGGCWTVVAYGRCYSNKKTNDMLLSVLVGFGISWGLMEPAFIILFTLLPCCQHGCIVWANDRANDIGLDLSLLIG